MSPTGYPIDAGGVRPMMGGSVPASSRTLSQWYPRLAAALEAGVGLERSLMAIPGPAAAEVEALATRLRAGDDLATALERAGAWLPTVDRQLIVAGAAAGRLPDALRRLAVRHEAVVRSRVGMMLGAAYPLGVLHFGAVALPISELVSGGGAAAYVVAVAGVLGPLWLVTGLWLLAVWRRWRPALVALDLLPFVGGFRRARAVADLAFVLEALVVAGVRIDAAWLQAAAAAGDPRLGRVAAAAVDAVRRGEAVAPVLAGRRELPAPFAQFYASGESSGRLEEALQILQRHFSDAAAVRLKIAGLVYPALIFVAVATWVAVRVVLFYAGYFRRIDEMMR